MSQERKEKSILLFFVLLIMATFLLSGLSIEKASQEEQKSLRQTLGGFFTISPEYSKNPYYKMMIDGDGGYTLHTERLLCWRLLMQGDTCDMLRKKLLLLVKDIQ